MLTFDYLRVKNVTYGGTSQDLEWALSAHAALTSQGVRNSVAQSKVRSALKTRIGSSTHSENAEDWSRTTFLQLQGNSLTGIRNLWRDICGNFLNYSCLAFIIFGVLLLLNGEQASGWIVFSCLLVGIISAGVQLIWQMMLGRMRLVPAIALGAIVLLTLVVGIGFFAVNNDLSVEDRGSFPAWVLLPFGLICGCTGLLIIKLTTIGPLSNWHKPLTDAQWEHRARSYARQKLLLNEAFLDQHIAAARQAANAEDRPLVEMCGNPISYLKTAPQDPTYKSWIQIIGFSLLCFLALAIATFLLLTHEGRWWLGYLLAAVLALSVYGAYREYSRAKSRYK